MRLLDGPDMVLRIRRAGSWTFTVTTPLVWIGGKPSYVTVVRFESTVMPSPSTEAGSPSLTAESSARSGRLITNELLAPLLSFDTTVRPAKVSVTLPVMVGAPGNWPPNPDVSTDTDPVTHAMPAGTMSLMARLVIVDSGRVTVSR